MEELQIYLRQLSSMALEYAPRLVLAAVVLLVGIRIVNRISRMLGKTLERTGIGPEIQPFITSFAGIALKVLLVFSVAGIIGVDLTSFIAVLAAAGFAVGLALQGSLSNFAAGILILVFRPFKVGDWIEVEDKFGKVEEVQVFNSVIVTPGRKTLIIPNGKIIDGIVTNYSKKELIRIELNVTMPYSEHFPRIRELILDQLGQIPKVLANPAPEVGIEAFDSHNVLLAVRPYVLPDDYWEVRFEVYERIKAAFHANGVQVAYSEGVELGEIGL